MCADNLTNLGEYCQIQLFYFRITDLSSVLISENVASFIVNFPSLLMFFLFSTILG